MCYAYVYTCACKYIVRMCTLVYLHILSLMCLYMYCVYSCIYICVCVVSVCVLVYMLVLCVCISSCLCLCVRESHLFNNPFMLSHRNE